MTPSKPVSGLTRVLKRTLSSQLGRLAAQFGDRPVPLSELGDVLQLRGHNALLIFLAFPFVTPVPLPGVSTVFGFVVPLINSALGVWLGKFTGLELGGATLLGVLSPSASCIAAPAAIRLSLPDANPTLYLTASLAITFPFNITLSIPIYLEIARRLYS